MKTKLMKALLEAAYLFSMGAFLTFFFSACQKSPVTTEGAEDQLLNLKSTGKISDISTGLIAHWPFDGNGNDSSGNGNNATLINLTSTADRFGNPAGAYYFNGTNSFASVADNASLRLNNTDFTLNAWVKLNSYNASNGSIIMSKHISGANNGWGMSILGYTSTPLGAIFYGPGGGSTNATGADTIGLGSWHMVTCVYRLSAGTLSIYKDGILDNTTSGILTANGAITAALYIGKDLVTNSYFLHGALDDLRIYGRALSNTDIQELYNPMGLIAHWPFDGNGNDASGNGNNATLTNLTSTTDRFGNPAGAYYFNGTNSFASVADNASLRLNNTDFTLNAWVKLDSYNASNGSIIMSKHISGANNGWGMSILGYTSTPLGAIFYGPGGGSTNATGTDTVGLGSWHMVTCVYRLSAGTLSIYKNGILDNTTSGILTANGAITAALYIGKDLVTNSYFLHGALDDLRIYGRALSNTEIQELL